jgi:hypothetical protein
VGGAVCINVILKGLQNGRKFGQVVRRRGVLAMLPSANMRHYNIDVNSISGLMSGPFERAAKSVAGQRDAEGANPESGALGGAHLWYLGCRARNAADGRRLD